MTESSKSSESEPLPSFRQLVDQIFQDQEVHERRHSSGRLKHRTDVTTERSIALEGWQPLIRERYGEGYLWAGIMRLQCRQTQRYRFSKLVESSETCTLTFKNPTDSQGSGPWVTTFEHTLDLNQLADPENEVTQLLQAHLDFHPSEN